MPWYDDLAWFVGGAFLANAVPHFVSGVCGRAFPSPFASPPGKGLSSPVINVLWGTLNFVVGYLLVFHIGAFHLRDWSQMPIVGIGALLVSLMLANHFGSAAGSR